MHPVTPYARTDTIIAVGDRVGVGATTLAMPPTLLGEPEPTKDIGTDRQEKVQELRDFVVKDLAVRWDTIVRAREKRAQELFRRHYVDAVKCAANQGVHRIGGAKLRWRAVRRVGSGHVDMWRSTPFRLCLHCHVAFGSKYTACSGALVSRVREPSGCGLEIEEGQMYQPDIVHILLKQSQIRGRLSISTQCR